jgi:hypothetical protein
MKSNTVQTSSTNMAAKTSRQLLETASPSPSQNTLPFQTTSIESPQQHDHQPVSSTPLPFTNPTTQESAPYPPTFAEIVALITSGAEIPGIKDVPNVIYPMSMATKPSAPRRRKPWEKDIPEDVILNGMKEGTFGDHRDNHIIQEFPEDDVPKDSNSSVIV